jgi:hypothetical protein
LLLIKTWKNLGKFLYTNWFQVHTRLLHDGRYILLGAGLSCNPKWSASICDNVTDRLKRSPYAV